MATLTTNWQDLGSAQLYGNSVTIVLQGKYSEQSTENNMTLTQFRVITGGSDGFRTTSGEVKFNGHYNDSASIATYPSYINPGDTILYKEEWITHNEDGTKYISLGAYAYGYIYGARRDGTIDNADIYLPAIDRYPMITSAPNFNDEENPTISYTKSLGFSGASVEAVIAKADGTTISGISYRSVNVSNGSYTFNLTTSERNALRNLTPNSNTIEVRFILRTTTTNNQVYASTSNKQLTIINANPDCTYTELETNTKVSAILGTSATKVVQNASIVRYTITPSLKKGAGSVASVYAKNNGLKYDATLSSGNYVVDVPIQTNVTYLYVVDSRGNPQLVNNDRPATKTITKSGTNFIVYSPVDLLQFSFERVNPTSSNVKLNVVNAKYYQATIGNSTNAPIIKYKLGSGNYVTIPSSNYVIDNTNHTISISNYVISNILSYKYQGTFTLTLEDLLSSDSNTQVVIKGIPTFEAGEHEFQVNGNLYIADEDKTIVTEIRDLIYPIGSIYMSINSTNPSTLFGGTWEQLEDTFLLGAGSIYTAGNSGGSASHTHSEGSYFAKMRANGNTLYYSDSQHNWTTNRYLTVSGNADASTNQDYAISVGGTSGSSSNLPPYLVVYIWKRVR